MNQCPRDQWVLRATWNLGIVCLLITSSCSNQRSSTTPAPRNGVMVVDGNSWTQSRHGAVAMPENVWRQLGSPPDFRVVDEAGSGHGMVQMLDPQHQRRVDAHVTAGQLNVLIVWEGCHDLVEGYSAADAARRLQEYCQRRKSAGFIVVMLTLLPCRDADWPADYEDKRDALNQLILAAPRQYADYVIDVSELSDPEVFSPIDHVHLTEVGSVKVADRVSPCIHALLSKQK